MRTAELVNRKLPPSKSGVSCTSGLAGTALSRTCPEPPRTCRSGSTLISSPAVASATNGSAMSGTSPGARTETVRAPPASSRPSDTTSDDAARRNRRRPPRRRRPRPPRSTRAASGSSTVAARRKNGSPSGSTQSPSTAVVTRPPLSTEARFSRCCTGGAFSSGSRTVTVTLACAVPPQPSPTVYPNETVPDAASSSVSCSCWLFDTRSSCTPGGNSPSTPSTTRTSPFAS